MQLDGFRTTQQQQATRPHCIVEGQQHTFLDIPIEIDQQVATADQVNPRERRVFDHVLRREYHALPQEFLDLVGPPLPLEIPAPQLVRHALNRCFREDAVTGKGHRILIKIGGKNHVFRRVGLMARKLGQQNRDGVSLFTGRTAGHPDTEHIVRLLGFPH